MNHTPHSHKRRPAKAGQAATLLLAAALAAPAAGQLFSKPPLVQAVSGGASAQTQETPAPRWPPRDRKSISLSVTAQAEGKPALAYALLPPPEETEKGNAAVKYLAAISNMPKVDDDAWWDQLDAVLRDAPLADLNPDEAFLRKAVDDYSYVLRTLKEGAKLDHVDWETNVRTQGYRALLPSLGGFRTAANVLAVEIRLDIRRHDWAAANDKFKTGFALAHRLSEGETLIESLVGAAIASMLCQTLEDWVAEPGAPNLYWPLTNLPAPFCDVRRPMSFEHGMAFMSFPELQEMKAGHYSADLWTSMVARIPEASGGGDFSPLSTPWKRQTAAAALGMLMYPQAKDYLVSRGIAREAVEKMPVYEALERYFVLSYQDAIDDTFKWAGLPAAQAWVGMNQASRAADLAGQRGDLNILAKIFLPSLSRAVLLTARLDRQVAMLRVVEALRAHAAETGAFPAR
ncbi:MAG TPA: hypothetical protein VHM90_11465, partial [Phycisphaerae bacterium]|nr:hypothetical protein [Phycisphaerae bacterium]